MNALKEYQNQIGLSRSEASKMPYSKHKEKIFFGLREDPLWSPSMAPDFTKIQFSP